MEHFRIKLNHYKNGIQQISLTKLVNKLYQTNFINLYKFEFERTVKR